jgi:hypothetical protein
MPKYLMTIPDANRSGGLTVNHTGRSGVSYPFVWNQKYAKHIYLGRELTPKEFNKVARDIFTAPKPRLHVVPEIYVDPYGRDDEPPVVDHIDMTTELVDQNPKIVHDKANPPQKGSRSKKEQPSGSEVIF